MHKKLLATVLGATALLSTQLQAAEVSFPHLVTQGHGEIIATADMAKLHVEVTEKRATAKEAKQAVDKAVVAFIARLEKQGVKRADIQSANISLHPEYKYPKNKEPQLVGYRAEREVTVTVHKLEALNTYLDGSLVDGINRIRNIELKSSKEAELKQQARTAAIKDAKEKAQSVANGFGESVDGVWQITYLTQSVQPYVMQARTMSLMSNDVGESYQNDKIVIEDSVDVIFKLAD
ncbi:oxidative stress defense protein [Photobacterium jeanii]|uniref:Oxidative stress defense protein n=1 Tax=Photobacterium jeanii TaxID=858640 RepID=A0A178K5H3_9GAMM|nr:oxidative stress defense protein [Photobacterium jeanii]OAN12559.1 oxidative stress defense protein [Photobacterium jeanii]PST86777.1 oxidative stress defense protein [Photobacterium jeanii]